MALQDLIAAQLFNIIQFIIVIAIGIVVTKLVTDVIGHYLKRKETKKVIKDLGYEEPILDLIVMVVRYVLYFITFIIALAQFGFVTIVFEAILILTALFAIVFVIYSLRDFIPNAASGIYLSRMKTIKAGDKIQVGPYKGEIVQINLVSTILKDETGRTMIIPNANLTKKEIIKDVEQK